MIRKECDVLVIGTGPAGAVASCFAAEKGANVLLVDKKSVVGVPVRCGEGIPGTVLDDFDIKHSRKWVANKCRYLRLVPPKGKDIVIEPHIDICVLNRDKIEQHLVERAEKKGVEVMLNTTAISGKRKGDRLTSVELHIEGEGPMTVKPRVVIAADGIESRVGRWVGLKTNIPSTDVGTCAQYLVEHKAIDKDVIEFWFGKQYVGDGYGWVFPKGKSLGNVGIGMLPNKEKSPIHALEHFMKKRTNGGSKSRFTVGLVSSCRPVMRSVKGNVMLVGDAARLVIALTGAGVANAFTSGRIAGRVAGDVGTGKKGLGHLETYEIRWRKLLQKKLDRSYEYRKKVVSSEKELQRFFRKVKVGMGLYKLSPRLFGGLFSGFFYKGEVETE